MFNSDKNSQINMTSEFKSEKSEFFKDFIIYLALY